MDKPYQHIWSCYPYQGTNHSLMVSMMKWYWDLLFHTSQTSSYVTILLLSVYWSANSNQTLGEVISFSIFKALNIYVLIDSFRNIKVWSYCDTHILANYLIPIKPYHRLNSLEEPAKESLQIDSNGFTEWLTTFKIMWLGFNGINIISIKINHTCIAQMHVVIYRTI
jgi:hypothetical protein